MTVHFCKIKKEVNAESGQIFKQPSNDFFVMPLVGAHPVGLLSDGLTMTRLVS